MPGDIEKLAGMTPSCFVDRIDQLLNINKSRYSNLSTALDPLDNFIKEPLIKATKAERVRT